MPAIPAFGGLRQKDHEFKASMSYQRELQASLERPCLKESNDIHHRI
jgi:hypothetical protein